MSIPSNTIRPLRGDVWMVDLDPVRGHEQAGTRPALVTSVDAFNNSPAGLAIVVPMTSKQKQIVSHVAVDPPEGGLSVRSYIKCEDVRSVSQDRLVTHRGRVSTQTTEAVERILRRLMGL